MSLHLKVKLADTELLTTRLYFADDPLLETDSIFSCVEDNRLLLLDPIRVTTDAGEEVETATQLLVIDT